ncbi:MAG TPA: hypothetical protein VKX35_02700 [Fermentimonas sp.]|nr:hypothetical protein [Fermentimonas sp.]
MTIFLFAIGCSDSTSPDITGSISGRVELLVDDGSEPVTDFSGVVVAIYSKANLDSTLVRINNEHPNIGVIISQETEFDHRDYNPVAMTETNISGDFLLRNVPGGNYNLVFIKESWSIKYLYNITCDADSENNLGVLEMHPNYILSGVINDPFVFRAEQQYIIENDVHFANEVSIENESIISIAPNKTLNFHGPVNTGYSERIGDKWKVISTYSLLSVNATVIDSSNYYNGVAFYSDDLHLKNGFFRHLRNSVHINSSNATLEDIYVRNFGNGVSSLQSEIVISNLTLRDGYNMGLQLMGMEEFADVSNSVFLRCRDGIVAYSGGGFSISNSYFAYNNNAIYPQNCQGEIRNNSFYNNGRDIPMYIASTNIEYNNFYRSLVTGIYPRNFATINNNNFYTTERWFIDIIRTSTSSGSCVFNDLDATNNYWGVNNVSDYLRDGNYDENCWYFIIYIPKRNNPVPEAGIERQ